MVRRSVLFLTVLVPGFLLNFGLAVAASVILDARHFGLFYLAMTLTVVVAAPSILLSFFYARAFAALTEQNGESVAWKEAWNFLPRYVRWSTLAAAVVTAALVVVGYASGVTSYLVVILIAVITWLTYITDAARAVLQGTQNFFRLGVFTTSWMAGRFVFGVAGLLLFGTVWAGLAGVALAGLAAAAGFYVFMRARIGAAADAGRPASALPSPRSMLPFGAGFGILMGACYLDVILAYVVLDREALGVYAASAVLPKALLTLTMPILQVVFPVVVVERIRERVSSMTLVKGIGITLGVAGAGAVFVVLLADILCGAPYGVRLCRIEHMTTMTFAIMPFCVLRVLVLVQLALGRDWQPMVLAPAAAIFAVFVLVGEVSPAALANSFLVFGLATLACYALVCTAAPAFRMMAGAIGSAGIKRRG